MNLILRCNFASLAWVYRNRRSAIAFPVPLRLPSPDPSTRPFEKAIRKWGSCHGQCLALLDAVRQDPDAEPQTHLLRMRQNTAAIFLYQVAEMRRGNNAEVDAWIENQGKLRPLALPSGIHLIRCFVAGNPRAHSLLYHAERSRFWFYNSAIGLFEYGSEEQLQTQFFRHLTAHFSGASRDAILCLAIETFSSPGAGHSQSPTPSSIPSRPPQSSD